MTLTKIRPFVWVGDEGPENSEDTPVFLTTSLASGPKSEPPIGNKAFLESHLDHGIWLRVMSAAAIVEALRQPKLTMLQKLSLVTEFFQLAGAAHEDSLANWISWSIWSKDKSRSLPRILNRLQLRFSKFKGTEANHFSETRKKVLETGKRVDVYPGVYLQGLLSNTKKDWLPSEFGIPWKPHASRKGFNSDELYAFWQKLPMNISETIVPLIEDQRNLISALYNKIKHGPQLMVFEDPVSCLEGRGFTSDQISDIFRNMGPQIRLLTDGDRTQESQDEINNHIRVAPFLRGDFANLFRCLNDILLQNATMLGVVGTFIFNATFPDSKRFILVKDEALIEVAPEI